LAIAPTAQKRGIKNLLCILAFGKKRKKLDTNFICELLRNSEPPFAFPKN
jgi:hypothetical protein